MRLDDGALPGLQRLGLVRSVRTPQFEGITVFALALTGPGAASITAPATPLRSVVGPETASETLLSTA